MLAQSKFVHTAINNRLSAPIASLVIPCRIGSCGAALRPSATIFPSTNPRLVGSFCAVLLSTLLFVQPAASQENVGAKAKASGKAAAYMGTGSCSSSNCHGAGSPRSGNNVMQNEYTTWFKHDKHAQAWIVLTNDDSKKIVKNLGLGAAEKEPWCLGCHATYVPDQARRSSNYTIEDGVSCESCHGPGENYLGPHTASDATHQSNLEHGMWDVVGDSKRAQLCLSCHFGNEDKYVNHRLIGAGHPRLSFELDTFSYRQPKHWDLDQDYQTRKGSYNSGRAWLIGQIERSLSTLDLLTSPKLSKEGVFPELTVFYCFACHHSLTEDQWKVRDYAGQPGTLRPNLSSLLMVSEGLAVISPSDATALRSQIDGIHQGMRVGQLDSVASARKTLTKASEVARNEAYDATTLKKLLRQVLNYAASSPHLQYEVAEQVAMAASSFIGELSPDSALYQTEMTALFESLRNSEEFRAEEFTAAATKFVKSLGK
jgi:hypothetical protein